MNFATLKEKTVSSISKTRAIATDFLAAKSKSAVESILKDLAHLNDILTSFDCRVENASLIMKSSGLPEVSVDIDRGEGLDVDLLKAAAEDSENSLPVRAALKALLATTSLDSVVESHGMRAGFIRVNLSPNPLSETVEVGLRFN